MNILKKIGVYKWVNILAFLSLSLTLIFTSKIIASGWCIDNCSFELKNGFIDPIYYLLSFTIVTLFFLLLTPSRYFKLWLLYFASWAIPISLVVIFSESPYTTGGVLGLAGRQFNATIMGGMLVIGTIMFVLTHLVIDWWKTRSKVADKEF